ncbi:MAG: VWA domain-containing protein [Armatimonadetes bacterium]|nr:VWA domain-containing protein [Armatimonadota bacterium]
MRFTDPLYLLLLIPVIAGLLWSWRFVGGMAKPRKRLSFVIRALLGALLVLALAGPQSYRSNQGQATVFVIDRSDSISEADKKAAIEFISQATGELDGDDVAGIVAFGEKPMVESIPGGRRTVNRIEANIQSGGSDLASALRVAAATFPTGKGRRIVILSDGNETSGDAMQAAEVLESDGIEIDVVALGENRSEDEAAVVDVQAPPVRSTEEPFDIKVVVESSIAQPANIVIDRDGKTATRVPVQLKEGINSFLVPQKIDDQGFYRYRVSLEVEKDQDRRNNIGATFLNVKGKPKILIIQDNPNKTELARALASQGITAEVFGSEGLPTRPEELQPYDAIILNDFNAANALEPQMKMIKSAVRDTGIGFAMVGGEGSFLPGGWYGTPVADVLPVDLNVRQRKSFPSTSVMIVIDTSGSMGAIEDGMTKLQLAMKAASQTVEMMGPQDRAGVAGSGSKIDYIAPLQSLKDKSKVIAQIRRLADGGGGIFAEPSVKFGYDKLKGENSKVRHFILLADGADCDQHGVSAMLADEMRKGKITLTCVAIGDGKDVPFLKQISSLGGGRFFLAEKAGQLPAIFTQDVAQISRSAIEEGAFLPKLVGGDEMIRGIGSTPPLLAYCISEARPLAKVGMLTQKDDPLLASWQYGLGTSVAFTSDAQSRWANNWVNWEGFDQFWSQVVRTLTRKASSSNYDIQVSPNGGKGQVRIEGETATGQPIDNPELKVRLSLPDGNFKDIDVLQEAPGVFVGQFPTDQLGSYIVSVSEPGAGGEQRVATDGFAIPYPPEYRAYRANTALLNGIVEVGGGKLLTEPKEALRPVIQRGQSIRDLWMYFLLAAVLLLPLDVAIRRFVLPFNELASLFRRKGKVKEEVESTKGRLMETKKKVRQAEKVLRETPTPAPEKKAAFVPLNEPLETPDQKAESAPDEPQEVNTRQALLERKRQRDEERKR